MKSFILACLLVVAVSGSPLGEQEAFLSFKAEHGKTYKNQVEEITRFNIFTKNVREIEEHNALFKQGHVSYEKGINQFSDLTQEEFIAKLTLQAASRPILETTPFVSSGITVPASADWRTEGQVTAVKDQKQCGSCWAFSVTGSTEGAYFRSTGKLESFSEQQLVDCSRSINDGCDGGYLDETFPYIQKNGLQSEASYPYTAKDGKCVFDATKVITKVSKYVSIAKNEPNLLEAVGSIGPVSVAIDASYINSYKSGVYADTKCSARNLNHGVLIVGYGTEGGKDYWIVKNSWGASWGDKGYLKILRGVNECGIAEDDVYPIV